MDERKNVYASPVKTTKFVNNKKVSYFPHFFFGSSIFMHAFWYLSIAAVWYSVQVSQSWSCWRIQDTSPPARVGWRIYWNALVPQSHIPVIDLLKHYHSQLGLAVQPPLPPPSVYMFWSMKVPSTFNPTPLLLQLQLDQSQLTYSEKRRRWLVFLNQEGSNLSSAMIIIVTMGSAILLIKWNKDDLSLLWAAEIPRDLHLIRQPFNLFSRAICWCQFNACLVQSQ